ncbi:MAG: M14 family metallopeptidase, partial [Longimicrobiales bacterium]|nr:M14 family metallopeptidase [Longimicrobiales bacterium]
GLAALPATHPLHAQDAPPSPEGVLGWALGERFSDVPAVYRYFEALAQASPLVSVQEYGRSVEGRPLLQVLIATPDHRARLDEILARNRELTDPDTPEARARAIAASNPAVVYFSYGVHGNESSSSEAAMWTAWDLVRGAPDVAGVLDSVVVVIDPAVNPDGRERYVNFYRAARGPVPNPDPATREHREPWPGGRTNHYHFDLNRDWSWGTQAETRARLATWDRWNPQVHVDFHEMSPNSSYFFFPPATPINPLYPEHIGHWAARIGDGNAAAFARQGWLFFTEESYDLFYPGYGDSWPSLLGAIGMTYEQAGGGSAGLAYARSDGDTLTLQARATHHRVAGNATLRTAADGKTDLLLGFAGFHRSVDAGHPDILLVPAASDRGARLDALLDELTAQGIRHQVAAEPFEARASAHRGYPARSRFPAGTVRVPARQPRGLLAVTLLQAETVLDATFSYDISAWSRPYAFGVEAHAAEAGALARASWRAGDEGSRPAFAGEVQPSSTPYGYLVEPGFHSWPALAAFLREGGRGRVLPDTFRIGGRPYPRGTVFLPAGMNPGLAERVRAAGIADAVPVPSALTETGPDLGSGSAGDLRLPRVALIGGEGTSSGSFGAHRHFLDTRLGLPYDAVNASALGDLDLARYQVVVVPEGASVGRGLSDAELARLRRWIQGGGTLVAVGSGAAGFQALTGIELRRPAEPEESARLDRALRPREERDLERWEGQTPGTILRAVLDPGHPLAFGAAAAGDEHLFVLSSGNGFEPTEAFESAAWFEDGLEKLSGVIGAETLERLARSSWLVERRLGRGSVILFADDPLFRGMWYAGFQPYANALLLGPAF